MVIDRAPTMEPMHDTMLTIPTLPPEQYELSLPDQVAPPAETRMLATAMLLSMLMVLVIGAGLMAIAHVF